MSKRNRFKGMDAQTIINEMGWNESSRILHLEGFIEHRKLTTAYEAYLARVAKEEEMEVEAVGDL